MILSDYLIFKNWLQPIKFKEVTNDDLFYETHLMYNTTVSFTGHDTFSAKSNNYLLKTLKNIANEKIQPFIANLSNQFAEGLFTGTDTETINVLDKIFNELLNLMQFVWKDCVITLNSEKSSKNGDYLIYEYTMIYHKETKHLKIQFKNLTLLTFFSNFVNWMNKQEWLDKLQSKNVTLMSKEQIDTYNEVSSINWFNILDYIDVEHDYQSTDFKDFVDITSVIDYLIEDEVFLDLKNEEIKTEEAFFAFLNTIKNNTTALNYLENEWVKYQQTKDKPVSLTAKLVIKFLNSWMKFSKAKK